jgi:isocitrate dehydrogenase
VWLDADGRARRVVTSFPLAAPADTAATGPDATMRVQTDYYAFGVPVRVVPPAPAEVRPYRALARSTTPG